MYADAAFACGWSVELGTNPESIKCWTGSIIEIMRCPIFWVTRLQKSIDTSTMESEYTALSMSLRAAIPLMDIAVAITNGLHHLINWNPVVILLGQSFMPLNYIGFVLG